MNYKKPDVPNKAVLPTTQDEAKIWNKGIKMGWESGLAQANDIFASNVSRLKRDFTGMILYRKLLSQGMISSPIVAKSNMGITGNSNDMRLNDQIMRITANSALQLNEKSWSPVLTHQ